VQCITTGVSYIRQARRRDVARRIKREQFIADLRTGYL
jgi:hypothetical protein